MSLSKNWDLQIDPSVLKTLRRMPRRKAEIILEVVRLLPVNPYFGDIRKIKGGYDIWRRRVGSYRIFYKIKIIEKIVLVFNIEIRSSGTY